MTGVPQRTFPLGEQGARGRFVGDRRGQGEKARAALAELRRPRPRQGPKRFSAHSLFPEARSARREGGRLRTIRSGAAPQSPATAASSA